VSMCARSLLLLTTYVWLRGALNSAFPALFCALSRCPHVRSFHDDGVTVWGSIPKLARTGAPWSRTCGALPFQGPTCVSSHIKKVLSYVSHTHHKAKRPSKRWQTLEQELLDAFVFPDEETNDSDVSSLLHVKLNQGLIGGEYPPTSFNGKPRRKITFRTSGRCFAGSSFAPCMTRSETSLPIGPCTQHHAIDIKMMPRVLQSQTSWHAFCFVPGSGGARHTY
jgi:hypothetical protein